MMTLRVTHVVTVQCIPLTLPCVGGDSFSSSIIFHQESTHHTYTTGFQIAMTELLCPRKKRKKLFFEITWDKEQKQQDFKKEEEF